MQYSFLHHNFDCFLDTVFSQTHRLTSITSGKNVYFLFPFIIKPGSLFVVLRRANSLSITQQFRRKNEFGHLPSTETISLKILKAALDITTAFFIFESRKKSIFLASDFLEEKMYFPVSKKKERKVFKLWQLFVSINSCAINFSNFRAYIKCSKTYDTIGWLPTNNGWRKLHSLTHSTS